MVWDSTDYYSGAGAVAAHGRVPGGKTKVKLQVTLPGGWHTFASTPSAAVFDTDKWSSGDLDWAFIGKKPLWGEVMLHEFGQAFGLDHANGADEIMYWQAGNGVYPDGYFRGLYAAGDLAGLARTVSARAASTGSTGSGRARGRIQAPGPLP